MQRFEVIVIGGGPSGAIAARDLARAGTRVALIDGAHPREKPCGGGVTGRALALTGGASGGRPIQSVRFESGARASIVPLPPGALNVHAREAFDAALLHEATTAGATLFPQRATALSRTARDWTIRLAGAEPLTATKTTIPIAR